LSKKKYFITGIYLLLAVSLHLSAGNIIKPQKGVVDISSIDIKNTKSIKLNGEWIFFADTLLLPAQIPEALKNLPYKYLNIPSFRKDLKLQSYGTYYLKILSDSCSINDFVISTKTIHSSAKIFVNGKLTGSIGVPANNKKDIKPGVLLKSKGFSLKKENDVVIQYANFHKEKAGIVSDIYLQTKEVQIENAAFFLIKYAIIIGTILFIIFNQINYYFIRKKDISSFYIGAASFFIAGYIVFMSMFYWGILFSDINLNYFISLKIWRFSYFMTVCFFILYTRSLFPTIYPKWLAKFTVFYTVLLSIITFFAPLHFSSILFNHFMFFTIIIGLSCIGAGFVGRIKKIEDASLFLFGFGFFLATVINDVLHNLLIIHSVNLLDVGIFGMMLTQAQIINTKLNRTLLGKERLSKHLQYVNINLEKIVKHRTEEIEEQKAEIETQRDFAMMQHELISKQKKTITDSINYAREIQQAVLPNENLLREYFSDSFILFKPKDYVSGDFYFIRHYIVDDNPYLLFSVADCTGHGVSGALLSMLGMSLLHEIVGYDKISKASEILEILRKKFKQTLSKRDLDNTSDGMSISLCLVNKNTGEMQYSGAFQSLIYIRDNTITKIKGANCIIGNYMHEVSYENHIMQLEKNDKVFLFTDGYADQMGDKNRGRFMKKRLLEQLISFNNINCKEQKTELNNNFENWRGNTEQIDDVLIMGVTV